MINGTPFSPVQQQCGSGSRISWVTTDFECGFQVMDCDDRALLDEWMSHWNDIVEFEVIPILTSEKAAAAIAPHL